MPAGTLIEAVRFGYGPLPQDDLAAGGVDADRVLEQLSLPLAKPIPREGLSSRARLEMMAEVQRLREVAKTTGVSDDSAAKALRALSQFETQDWVWDAVVSETGLAERLMNFWANRLTVAWRKGPVESLMGPYREEAIRPHVAGRFADMLAASAWHPAMMEYLDQARSVGPDSPFGLKQRRGLNENYAREFLELHSMGTGYSQTDVTELARLFAGMQYGAEGGFFDPDRAQPGRKTILGQDFDAGLDEINRLIDIAARRPETAQSLGRALAAHFIADEPPADLVDLLARVYLENDTALMPVYHALLTHPAAADPVFHKLRSPHDYVVATLRALGLGLDRADGKGRLKVAEALRSIGQPAFRAPGPDGWTDTAEAWVTAPALAARLNWAEGLASRFGKDSDPAALARQMLGAGQQETVTASGRAEQRWEGLAVLLCSPAFMRR